ncbi:MAG TPA: bacillithiol biosynthesis BshC [Thermoanaerobaculia bacterium]|nr:bacillithiol biosynthesis BshC [Thermoanaerobaculia bacterium]
MSWRVPLARYPGMNKFVLDWMDGDERFLWRTGNPACPDRQDCLSSTRPLSIVTGQQVGFAGGPLYTLSKLASVIRLKRDLEKQGIPVNAYFWLATEDHDFNEVAQLHVPVAGGQRDLVCIRAVRATPSRVAVGSLPVPEELITQLLVLLDIERPSWLREGITFRDSFAELITSIAGNEVTLIDSLDPELRRAGAPLFEQIRSKHDEIQKTLHERAQQLEQAGYKEQVIPRDGDEYTLLFHIDAHGTRTPERTARLQPGARGGRAEARPYVTSTSALTRPLLQDFVLKPDIFIGGPAEVAYYAQLAPLHDLLDIPRPRVALRGHVLVAPKRVARAFERYGIDPAEVFASPDAILAKREPEGVARVHALANEAKRDLMKRIEQIGELALPADHSLAGSIERSIGHIEYHFDKLAERAIKGLVRKDRERYAAMRELVSTLYPDRHVQDRVASWFAYLCRNETFVERVVEEVEPDSPFFKVIEL